METKICSKCKIEKESHQFFKIYKNKNKLRSRCKKCDKEYYLNNTNRYNQIRIKNKINKMQYDKIYNTQNKMKAKENKMLNKYKLTLDDWYNMLTNQYNQCYICNNLLNLDNPNNICVDHNHETGQVRKLLCRNCNLAITYNTTISILYKTIEYLSIKNTKYKYDKHWKYRNFNTYYKLLINECNDQCEICRYKFEYIKSNQLTLPHIDHNHKTEYIRGIVCSYCNSRIGKLKENKFILQSAIIYLEEFK